MLVTKKMTVDLARKTILGRVDAVRGDSAIALEMTLLCDGVPWTVPEDASVVIRYCQGTVGGTYDSLADGTAAYQAQGNVLTVRIAPEVCSAAGKTDFQVTILKDGSQITTFRLTVCVEGEISGSDKPGSYTNLAQWLLANGGDGQVAVNLELEDLRIGADGTAYTKAGDAVRAQVEMLQAQIANASQSTCACEKAPIDLTDMLVQDYYIGKTGGTKFASGNRCTDFIPVKGGYQLQMKNLQLQSGRAVCVYDQYKTFLYALAESTTATELTVTLPIDAVYLRATVHPTQQPDFCYLAPLESRLQFMDDRIGGGLDSLSPLVSSIDITDKIVLDYCLLQTGATKFTAGERCTDYIPVKGGYDICFQNGKVDGTRGVCVYDEDRNFLSCLLTGSTETEFTLTMPPNAAYLRTSIQATGTPVIRYTGIVDRAVELLAQEIAAKGYQTQQQVQTLIDNAINALPVYNGEVEDV